LTGFFVVLLTRWSQGISFGVEGDEITLPGIIWRAFEHGTTLNDVRLP
jgi:hypothetical protein